MSVTEMAPRVFSMDLGREVDRTKEQRSVGQFDLDFRAREAPNQTAREWTYAGSAPTLEGAIEFSKKFPRDLRSEVPNVGPLDLRIVSATTGEVLWKHTEHAPEGGHRRSGVGA